MVSRKLIKNRPIKIALVGCGRISGNHFQALQQFKGETELVAVCDNDPATLKAAQDKTSVPGFDNLKELLKKTDADAVALCTPSGLHAKQAIEVARSGRHVICEKPMATRWVDGLKMVEACDEEDVFLFIIKQNRRNSTLQLLKRAIDEGRFGRIFNVAVNVFWARPQSYYDVARWRGTWELDGGALMNQASHYIDLLPWFFGSVSQVFAFTATQARVIEAEDSGVMVLKWRNGAMGTVNVSMLAYPKNFEGSLTVIGEKGTVRIGGVAINEIQNWQFEDQRDYDAEVKSASYSTTSVYGHGHPLYYANVIKSIRGELKPETDGREGLKSLELLIAAYRSAKDQKPIGLPLERDIYGY